MIPEIIFPSGVGGNHVRWLLSIDPKFNLPFCTGSIDDKVTWICQNVYKNRTWNNWLSTEWKYRDKLDLIIKIDHFMTCAGETCDNATWKDRKQLLLTTKDNILATYHYFMVNIGLNNQTKQITLNQLTQWNNHIGQLHNTPYDLSNKKILPSDCIIDPVLDRAWYNEVISWAGYDDLYDSANCIQNAYYQCRQRAAKGFISYFEGAEFQSHLDFYKNMYVKEHQ